MDAMMTTISELIRHKWWANHNLLLSIAQHAPAADDTELRKLLHHILVANRYWLLLTLGQPFVDGEEKRLPESHHAVVANFSATEQLEMTWLGSATESDLDRRVQPRALPEITISIAQAMLQVSLHSHGHRSQCATRLRALGGTPLPMDFVLWVRDQSRLQ